MKIRFTKEFLNLLNEQVSYISRDKPGAARKFKKDLLNKVKNDLKQPFHYKKSIYFSNDLIRDYTFKGYTVVYEVSEKDNTIFVFEFIKYMNKL
jgi:mRNA-degrading endonuclease RelE of RelBE toxin-antitoxin system